MEEGASVHHSYGSYAPSTYGSYAPCTTKIRALPTFREETKVRAQRDLRRIQARARLGSETTSVWRTATNRSPPQSGATWTGGQPAQDLRAGRLTDTEDSMRAQDLMRGVPIH
jgi:hypothetical protein